MLQENAIFLAVACEVRDQRVGVHADFTPAKTGSSLLIFLGLIVPAVSSLFVRAVNSKTTC